MLVVLALAAVFGAAIGEHAEQRNLVFLEERQYAIVEQVGGDQGVLAVTGFNESDFGVGVEKRLLTDTTYTLDGADVVRIDAMKKSLQTEKILKVSSTERKSVSHLLHHLTIQLLRESFYPLKRKAAARGRRRNKRS
jgi:hypothetical protein